MRDALNTVAAPQSGSATGESAVVIRLSRGALPVKGSGLFLRCAEVCEHECLLAGDSVGRTYIL